jgi:hypothetical protein
MIPQTWAGTRAWRTRARMPRSTLPNQDPMDSSMSRLLDRKWHPSYRYDWFVQVRNAVHELISELGIWWKGKFSVAWRQSVHRSSQIPIKQMWAIQSSNFVLRGPFFSGLSVEVEYQLSRDARSIQRGTSKYPVASIFQSNQFPFPRQYVEFQLIDTLN